MSSDPAATQAGDPAPARPEAQTPAAAGTADPRPADAAVSDATAFQLVPENGASEPPAPATPRKGPLSFLSGALTSGLLAWLCLGLSQKVLGYYALHPPHYEARVAQSFATALKTMIVGMSFLATFSFAFVGLGLLLVFLRSLLPARPETPA